MIDAAAPVDAAALFAEASAHHAAGRLKAARRCLESLLAAEPRHADALNLDAIVACQRGDFDRARAAMRDALAYGGETSLRLRNFCEIHRLAGDAASAVTCGERAVLLDPNDTIATLNLAMAQHDAGNPAAAIACAETVLAAEPQNGSAHFARAQALLARGDYAEGWREYEWRWSIAGAERPRPVADVPAWDGAPLGDGRLLLIADQGFGDQIQFARFLPWAARRCGELVIRCEPPMRRIFARFAPAATLLAPGAPEPALAAYAPMTSLAYLAGNTLKTIPSAPYLEADPALAARWAARLAELCPAGMRRIGLVWAGRPAHRNDRHRSARLADFAPLTELPGCVFVTLQKGGAERQVGDYFGRAPLVNLGAEIEDFADTAAVLAGLDLVVTVDTSVAHLAGAMGRDVCVLLARAPDWRWMLGRADSPWYPSARLFRQMDATGWAGIMPDVARKSGRPEALPLDSTKGGALGTL